MTLTAKQKAAITQNLMRIKNGNFDETHIKELLIDIREFMPANSLTRELSHFIAHYERDSGKYYNLLALRMATLKLLLSQNENGRIDINVDLNRIPIKIWNVIFVAGIDYHNRVQHNTKLEFLLFDYQRFVDGFEIG